MQVAIEIKPQQIRRIVGRTAGVLEDGMSETQRTQIETGDKGIQEADRIIGGDVILQPLRQEEQSWWRSRPRRCFMLVRDTRRA